jgi:DNA helicase HerA-like ATPase
LVADGSFLLGTDRRGLPVRLGFGAGSGRHGLLLGASGAGKSNALLWTVNRRREAGFGVVVVDMKADPSLASRPRPSAKTSSSTSGRSTAATAGTRSGAATARS